MSKRRAIDGEKYMRYSAISAQKALDEYWEAKAANVKKSLGGIARKHGIPEQTMGRWTRAGIKKYEDVPISGPKPYLNREQEQALVEYALVRHQVALPMPQNEFKSIARALIVDQYGEDKVKNKKQMSPGWMQRVKKNHPEITSRSHTRLSKARANGANINSMKKSFTNLNKTIEDYTPCSIYNADETSIESKGPTRNLF